MTSWLKAMFTGLIEAVGEVSEVVPTSRGLRLGVMTRLAPELEPGDSLAVDGVCLTVVSGGNAAVHADISPETLRVTTLGTIARGAAVNLERPLRADARFGGHFVQGHVDATATIEAVRPEGDAFRVTISYPPALAAFLVRKGSVAVDGISLTVAELDPDQFDVQIIPFTWTHTNLSTRRRGDAVNLECDILGKYAVRAMELVAADRERAPLERHG